MASEASSRQAVEPSTELATFVSDLQYAELPDEAIRTAERCFVDTIAVGLAGASAAAGTTALSAGTEMYGDGKATIFGGGTAPVAGAAFVNGIASHALDYDDVSSGMDGHPSPTMVAPILTVAETLGATGEDAITAYVAGFETQCYLAASNLRDQTGEGLHARGWHPTAIYGTFGATAAVASLLGLDVDETRNALNIAASMPAGVKKNFGSLSKPMHSGQAGASGVRAAYLAQNGFDATDHALLEGFFRVYQGIDGPDPDVLPDLGNEWSILDEGVDIKKYPSCYATHTSIYATSTLVDEHDIDPESIQRIHLEINALMEDLLTYDDPRTEAEAKFSIPYPVAAAAVFDYIGIKTFKPETIETETVQRIRKRVEYERDPELLKDTYRVTVMIETDDGTYTRTQEEPPATHESPMSDAELQQKFRECATRTLDEETADKAYERLDTLREQTDLSSVSDYLAD
jgi:2-methylcitrate dehydratase PrpD